MMHLRSCAQHTLVLTAVLSSVASVSTAGAQSTLPAYSASTGRYRLHSVTKTSQTVMGAVQDFDASSDQVTTVAIRPNGGAFTLSIVIDSASVSTTAPVPAPDSREAIGATLRGAMTADGRVTAPAITDKAGQPTSSPAVAGMRSFLPRLRVGATVGASWVDTNTTVSKQNGADVTTTMVVTYTFAGDTAFVGAKHFKLATASTGTIAGTGNQGGADFTLKGTIVSRGVMVVSANGVLQGGEQTNDVQMIADVPSAGMQIPITQRATVQISRLP